MASITISFLLLAVVLGVANATFCFTTPFCIMTGLLCPPCYRPTPVVPPGGGGGGFTPTNPAAFNQATISATNAKRAAECAGPLTEDAALTAAAQRYADKLAATGAWAHSPEAIAGQYGENLAMQCGGSVTPNTAVDGWYNEKRFYNKNAPSIITAGSNMNGHYTALVWKGTTRVGCGVATGANGCTYVVCNYSAPGNNPATVGANVGC